MAKDKEKTPNKIRVIISDLPELKRRINFTTGNSWDIGVCIDGVEGADDPIDGRVKIHEIPEEWPVQVMLQWLNKRMSTRRKVVTQMEQEIASLQFVHDLAKRQLESLKA